MKPYGWADAPRAVRMQVEGLLDAVRSAVGPNLLGFYLHGSLAMGCFNPTRSDLDLLAVTREGMAVETKYLLAGILLDRSGIPHPVEISFLRGRDLSPWQFPTPFGFHYSEDWRTRFQEALAVGAWQQWNDRQALDPDLAAHITITRQRGVCLFGPPIQDIFPPVPPADYRASLLYDFADAHDAIVANPVYGVLNLCRVYWYLLAGRISSKEEAGAWALRALPEQVLPVIRQALALYRGTGVDERFAAEDLEAFAHHLDAQVRALSSAPPPASSSDAGR